MTFDEWSVYCEPLRWTGKYVYIRSVEQVGYVSSSEQHSGNPELNRIVVNQFNDDGRGITVRYSMDEAREDLILNITTLVTEDDPV